jgi:hypothetical protein
MSCASRISPAQRHRCNVDNTAGKGCDNCQRIIASQPVINLILIRKDSKNCIIISSYIIALTKSSPPCGLSLRILVQWSTPHDCVIQKALTTPPPCQILPHHVATSGYAQVAIILSCYGEIKLIAHEVGQKWPSCVTYRNKHGVRSQWRPCFRPGVSYIKLTWRGCSKRKNTLLGW